MLRRAGVFSFLIITKWDYYSWRLRVESCLEIGMKESSYGTFNYSRKVMRKSCERSHVRTKAAKKQSEIRWDGMMGYQTLK